MTRVKVCGITREADLDAAVEAGVDAVGLISDVTVDSPRELPPDRAAALARATPPFVATVLVTMPATPEEAADLVERVGADAVQLHGVGPADVAAVGSRVSADVVAAAKPEDATAYDGVADALLVDSLDDQGGGGTGRTHDWARARDLVASLGAPVVLAGGLTPGNVGEAVARVGPYAVDVASGVEGEGGVKDHDAVRAFVRAATGAAPREARP